MAKVNHEFQLYVTYFASMKTDKEKDRERDTQSDRQTAGQIEISFHKSFPP